MTDKDLRGTFRLAFLVGIISCLGELFGLVRYHDVDLSLSWKIALGAPLLARFLVSGAFLIVALRTGKPTGDEWILRLLEGAGLLFAVTGVISVAVLGSDVGWGHLRTALALVITGLLYVATKRRLLARGGVDR